MLIKVSRPLYEREVRSVSERLREIKPTVEEILRQAGAPGLSLGVLYRSQEVTLQHYGYRDVELRLSPDADTIYSINSLTKAFIGSVVGILVYEGKLDWYAPAQSLLPSFHSCDPEVSARTTVIDLLSHRTGVTAFDSIWLGSENSVLLDKSQILNTFGYLQNTEPFRASFVYNNFGYAVVALILEKVTGKSLSQLLQTWIFKPLGMSRTSTDWIDTDENTAKSYTVLDNKSPCEIRRPQMGQGSAIEAAGGIKSTLKDLLKFYNAFLSAAVSQFGSKSDFTPSSPFKHCRMLLCGHSRLPMMSMGETGYSLGWIRTQLPGLFGLGLNALLQDDMPVVGQHSGSRLNIWHGGSMPGSSTYVHTFPESQTIIVVLQNSLALNDTADWVSRLLIEKIFAPQDNRIGRDFVGLSRMSAQVYLAHQSSIKKQLKKCRVPETQHRPLGTYTGIYWNAIRNWSIEITENERSLTMCFQGKASERYDLQHYHNDTFSWFLSHNEAARRGRFIAEFGAEYYLIYFEGGRSGTVTSLRWHWNPEAPRSESFTRDCNQTSDARPQRPLRWLASLQRRTCGS
ncbi:hypothetical protein MMC28_011065 [Mycoblastus sanguinarius]|nr:hypothetical protein [Mycoblastus sanguinarius]